ncbi:AMP-binding protein [Saccharopolyspora sp. HNM0983]|uniref:AMP-binding protein n=1 Tax=Saccharopolyspora montiporae TaxID=2781240 RepID=A0A929FYW2_9PSEU|nr:fatty acyl-CoA synthetase [Saccharopolyspora sp. HNM0983]MBE9376236.1 AMP-binding protein [Saccharopolyspora sp. HNM0983]
MSDGTRTSTVSQVLRRSAARVPDRVALDFAADSGQQRQWTYAQLDAAVDRAAGMLLGVVEPGARVAAFGRNSDAYVIGFLACARAGLVHVPINYNLTAGELGYLLQQSGAGAVLVDPALSDRVQQVRAETGLGAVLPLRDAPDSLLQACSSGPVAAPDVPVDDGDLVQLLYTSGTTSQPKGAMMTHRALLHEYTSCLVGLDMTEHDRPLHVMPLYHSAQMHVFLLPYLQIGAVNTLLESPDPAEVLRRVERDGHGSFFAAPTLWVALANHPDLAGRDLGSLRKAFYGASVMPGPVLARLRERLPRLGFYNCFGQSEIGPLATILRPEEHDERPDSAGRPALFVEAKVVDEQGAEVPDGEVGEIVYRSPQLCTGYWDKPAETAEVFRDGWFRSGDLVRRDEQGYVAVVDRIKDVINSGGVQVASREVEDALYAHPAVTEVAVVAVPDERWVERIVAVVVAGGEVDEQQLVEHARTRLAGFKVPKQIRFVDDLPRNSAGKLLKRVLREEFADDAPAAS